jgi:hypothetical protein
MGRENHGTESDTTGPSVIEKREDPMESSQISLSGDSGPHGQTIDSKRNVGTGLDEEEETAQQFHIGCAITGRGVGLSIIIE